MVDILCVVVTFCRSHFRIQNNTEGIKVVNNHQVLSNVTGGGQLGKTLVRREQFVGSSGSLAVLSLGE